MRVRIVIIIIFTALAAAGYLFPRVALNASGAAFQQKKKETRRGAQTSQSNRRKPAHDYSKFSHRSDKHESLTCNACHKAPTANWQAAAGFPDIADFPTHESCVGCHRTEFFKGARPVICSICHTKVSPRDRARFAFGKPSQPGQFVAVFPHDKHQDVIAADSSDKGLASAHAVRGSSLAPDKNDQKYNNCAICHQTESGTPKPAGGFPDGFQPLAGAFKTSPVGHASCFNCHWKNQEPTHNDCAGCHSLSQTDAATLPAPQRISLKFTHAREEHVAECTACHINITRVKSLSGLKPDVPITSCSSCHKSSTDKDIATIETEFEQRGRDAGFVCAKCHTSDYGKRAVPASHRALLTE
jgi:hypothetical protein